jgi:hypothetical protein
MRNVPLQSPGMVLADELAMYRVYEGLPRTILYAERVAGSVCVPGMEEEMSIEFTCDATGAVPATYRVALPGDYGGCDSDRRVVERIRVHLARTGNSDVSVEWTAKPAPKRVARRKWWQKGRTR